MELSNLIKGGVQIILAIFMYLAYQRNASPFIKTLTMVAGVVLLIMGILELLQIM